MSTLLAENLGLTRDEDQALKKNKSFTDLKEALNLFDVDEYEKECKEGKLGNNNKEAMKKISDSLNTLTGNIEPNNLKKEERSGMMKLINTTYEKIRKCSNHSMDSIRLNFNAIKSSIENTRMLIMIGDFISPLMNPIVKGAEKYEPFLQNAVTAGVIGGILGGIAGSIIAPGVGTAQGVVWGAGIFSCSRFTYDIIRDRIKNGGAEWKKYKEINPNISYLLTAAYSYLMSCGVYYSLGKINIETCLSKVKDFFCALGLEWSNETHTWFKQCLEVITGKREMISHVVGTATGVILQGDQLIQYFTFISDKKEKIKSASDYIQTHLNKDVAALDNQAAEPENPQWKFCTIL